MTPAEDRLAAAQGSLAEASATLASLPTQGLVLGAPLRLAIAARAFL